MRRRCREDRGMILSDGSSCNLEIRGVQFVLSMMHKGIMVCASRHHGLNSGETKKRKRTKIGGIYQFLEIGKDLCIIGLGGMDAPDADTLQPVLWSLYWLTICLPARF